MVVDLVALVYFPVRVFWLRVQIFCLDGLATLVVFWLVFLYGCVCISCELWFGLV